MLNSDTYGTESSDGSVPCGNDRGNEEEDELIFSPFNIRSA